MFINCTTAVEVVLGQVVKSKLNTVLYMQSSLMMSFRKREEQHIMIWKNEVNYSVHS